MAQFIFGDYYARLRLCQDLVLMYIYGMHVARNKPGSTFSMSGQDISSYIFYIIGNGCRRRPQLPPFECQEPKHPYVYQESDPRQCRFHLWL